MIFVHTPHLRVVPLLVKQHLNAANRAAGNIRTMDTNAHQFPVATQGDPEETINNINQQIKHGKPNSKTQEAPDSNISGFLLTPEPLQKSSTPVRHYRISYESTNSSWAI